MNKLFTFFITLIVCAMLCVMFMFLSVFILFVPFISIFYPAILDTGLYTKPKTPKIRTTFRDYSNN